MKFTEMLWKIFPEKYRDSIRNNYHRKHKWDIFLLPFYRARAHYANKDVKFTIYKAEEIKQFKTSSTIFILGSGPSLNNLTDDQINQINNKNSCGINFSFLKKEIIPTFHQFSWERDYSREYLINAFASYREAYSDTVILLNTKAIGRSGHPMQHPRFFPYEAKCYEYDLPKPLHIHEGKSFSDEGFAMTVYYRGTLSLVLDLLVRLDYKNIILLGADLNVNTHFYDNFNEVSEYVQELYKYAEKEGKKFESMYVKKGKAKPFDEYLYALADYLKRKRGINLFTANKDDFLSPKLVAYFN